MSHNCRKFDAPQVRQYAGIHTSSQRMAAHRCHFAKPLSRSGEDIARAKAKRAMLPKKRFFRPPSPKTSPNPLPNREFMAGLRGAWKYWIASDQMDAGGGFAFAEDRAGTCSES